MKKRLFTVFMSVIVSFMCVFSVNKDVLAATQKSDGQNMKKVLYYYGKKKYQTAQKYNKKISKTARETCVAKMSSNMKEAYRKVVKKFGVDYSSGKKHIMEYYLSDIDNDKKADLMVKAGTCAADETLYVYQYKKDTAKKIGAVGASHTDYYAYPNHKGILGYGGMMGGEWITLVTIQRGKAKSKFVGSREIEENWFNLRCSLKSHVSYNDGDIIVDYGDLL